MNKKILFFITLSLVLSIFLGACSKKGASDTSELGDLVAVGDSVSVWYRGTLNDKSVFDSNIEEVAKAAGTYNPNRPYEPLSFVVGAHQMIEGFDKAVVGMKKGEKKTVNIPPEEAYGLPQDELTRTIPTAQDIDRIVVIDRFRNVPTSQFNSLFGAQPVVGKSYPNEQVDWLYTVRELGVLVQNVSTVKIEADLKMGKKVKLPNTKWDSIVAAINESSIVVRQDPSDGSMLETPFGNATITVTSDKIKVSVDAKAGTIIPGPQGNQVKIIEVKEGNMKLDLNHPLAGKTLTFEIEVVEVKKPTSPAAAS